jgi:peptide/nickel transport system permease protein
MATTVETQEKTSWVAAAATAAAEGTGNALLLALQNYKLILGLVLVLLVASIGWVGPRFVDVKRAQMGAVRELNMPPSPKYPLGTESTGRDMLALIVAGAPNTLKIGLIAGGIGTTLGVVLGFIAGYFRGAVDTVIRSTADILLMIPAIAVLLVIAAYVRVVTVEMMALLVAAFAWPYPTRAIRAQVLSLRERGFVQVAKLSGMNDFEIIFKELVPNLLPYLAAGFTGAVSGGILAAIGLEVLGLGPQRIPTLGMTLYWALFHAAVLRGLWWWWSPPIVVLIIIFTGLFLISMGLDEIANPRLRRSVQ